MLIIFGHRHYGRVDAHEGQHASTRFFHLWYLPLIPTESVWVCNDRNGSGHKMERSWKSVASGYGRIWGPLVALGAVAAAAGGALAAIPLAAVAAVAGGWSWTTVSLRGDREKLRSSFHLLAYGTRCDPLLMTETMASALKHDIEQRWAATSDGKSPEDIARLGAASLQQAVFAYGVLRLAARTHPAAREASEEILRRYAGADVAAVEGGPYRSLPE